jgi:hypothetical protein
MNNTLTPYENPLYTNPMMIGNLEIRPIDLLEHVLATGGTGSGKTRSFLLPCVEEVLKRFGTDQEQKAGMVLIDAKGDMSELAGECIRRSGREKDIYILGMGGNCSFSLFDQFSGDPTAVANFLFDTLEDRCSGKGGENESFWEESAKRLLRAGVICAKAVHGKDLGNLSGLRDGINLLMSIKDQEEDGEDCMVWVPKKSAKERLKGGGKNAISVFRSIILNGLQDGLISRQERIDVCQYVEFDLIPGNGRTWATIGNMTRNYIAQFSQPALQELFQPSEGKPKITPEDVIDRGLLLIVSLSPVIYGEAASPFRVALKKAFFDRLLQRNHLVTGKRGEERFINQIRPILLVMDEFHTTLSPKGRSSDAYFLDRAREFRCMCILATQGLSAISSVVRDEGIRYHLLNNCRTKFFFANDCPQTLEYFEKIGGYENRMVKSAKFERTVAPPRFRLPNHAFVDSPFSIMAGYDLNSQKEPRFSSSKLGSLPNGTALVVKKGRQLVSFTQDPGRYASGNTPFSGKNAPSQ